MYKRTIFIIVLSFCFFNTQCDEDDIVIDNGIICDQDVMVDEDLYNNLDSNNFLFNNIEIIDDCLTIEFAASGCDGNTWEFGLVDSAAIAESLPEQRYLKFQLINEELCLAVFTKSVSFNLRPLQIEGSNEIILNIEGFEEGITYSY